MLRFDQLEGWRKRLTPTQPLPILLHACGIALYELAGHAYYTALHFSTVLVAAWRKILRCAARDSFHTSLSCPPAEDELRSSLPQTANLKATGSTTPTSLRRSRFPVNAKQVFRQPSEEAYFYTALRTFRRIRQHDKRCYRLGTKITTLHIATSLIGDRRRYCVVCLGGLERKVLDNFAHRSEV